MIHNYKKEEPSQAGQPAVERATTENDELPAITPPKTYALLPPDNNPPDNNLPAKKIVRLEELQQGHLEDYAERNRLVIKIQSGVSVPQACREIGWSKSLRTAYDVWARFEKFGKTALPDQRWLRKPEATVLTTEVREIILAWYLQRRAAGPRAIWKLTRQSCRKLGLREPAETTVKNYLNDLPIGVKLARQGARGFEEWQKQHGSVIEQSKTTFANEIWQGDDWEMPIWIRRKIRGEWVAADVYASALLDDYSRANPGFWVSHKYPDSWSILILFRQAILRTNVPGLHACGIPFFTESDNGSGWISEAVRIILSSLGIQHIIDPPYHPNSKGKIERFFRFVDTSLLATLPGHKQDVGTTIQAAQKRVHEFLTIEQLREEINKWRVWYHNRVHDGMERKPIELWEETVRFRYPESEDQLNILLLKYDRERSVLNRGIKLVMDGTKHLYWSPAFDRAAGKRVRIRYNPEDMESVLIYDAESGEFLCEAWDSRAPNPRYTLTDIKAARIEEKQRLHSISVRLKEYHNKVLGGDRLVEQRKEWDEARQLAAELPEITEEENWEEKELAAAMEELRRLNRQQD